MKVFESFFLQRVRPMIEEGNRAKAIEILQAGFASMPTQSERSEVYHWLANLQTQEGFEALTQRDIPTAREKFGEVEEYYLKALDEYPYRPSTLIALARFYITPLGQPEKSFPLLEPFVDPPESEADGRSVHPFYEHTRRVLRGIVLAIIGSTEEAAEQLLEAYSGEFNGVLPGGPEVGVFQVLLSFEGKLPNVVLKEIEKRAVALGATGAQCEVLRKLGEN